VAFNAKVNKAAPMINQTNLLGSVHRLRSFDVVERHRSLRRHQRERSADCDVRRYRPSQNKRGLRLQHKAAPLLHLAHRHRQGQVLGRGGRSSKTPDRPRHGLPVARPQIVDPHGVEDEATAVETDRAGALSDSEGRANIVAAPSRSSSIHPSR
jgi:hypothetical protein